jgi:hypothetical protein
MSLTDALLGTWAIESYVFDFEDGTRLAPYGDAPAGYLAYAPDGHVSVHMMARGRPRLDCDTADASGEAARTALATHISYAGTWEVADAQVVHHVTVSSLQDFVGVSLQRDAVLDGDCLTLSAPNASFGGKTGRTTLVWRRLPTNSEVSK